MNDIQRYLDAGYEVAGAPDFADVTPGLHFRTERFPGQVRNVAIRKRGVYVLRFEKRNYDFEDEVSQISALVGPAPLIRGERLAQWLFEAPFAILTGRIGGAYHNFTRCEIADAALAPPSRLWLPNQTIDHLRWEGDNLTPGTGGPALWNALTTTAKITHGQLAYVQGLHR